MSKKKCPYNDRNGFAYVYVNRKPVALKAPDGTRCKTGTQEALAAYHRFNIEILNSPTGYTPPTGKPDVTIDELTAAYLTYAEARLRADYTNVCTIVKDFLLPLYGGGYPADSFSPKCLKGCGRQ